MLKFKSDELLNWSLNHYADFQNLEFSICGDLLKIYEHEKLTDGHDGYSILYYFVKNSSGYFDFIQPFVDEYTEDSPLSRLHLEKVEPLKNAINLEKKQFEILGRVVCVDLLFSIKSLATVSKDNCILMNFDNSVKVFSIATSDASKRKISMYLKQNETGEYKLNTQG